jgi:hypothetical protein
MERSYVPSMVKAQCLVSVGKSTYALPIMISAA